jgi:hypothetical protein
MNFDMQDAGMRDAFARRIPPHASIYGRRRKGVAELSPTG